MKQLNKIESANLSTKLAEVDSEFKDFLSGLVYEKEVGHENLKTFSPIDAVEEFEQKGLHAVREVSRDEMLADGDGFKKLMANMLAECRPGALSEEDLQQFSGINGREATGQL